MRRCRVSMMGKDHQRHTTEIDALSLFDAAYQAHQEWAKFWWFDPDIVIEVRSGNNYWCVRQDRLRVWAYGSSPK
jgi:hypothetical protein